MSALDVVYIVKRGDVNDELRYSLRSLANLPHGQVWIVGHKPKWVVDVRFVQGNRFVDKWLNVFDNLRIACDAVEAERFIVMNDDFFVTRPVEKAPSWHRCSLDAHIQRVKPGTWKASLVAARSFLTKAGFTDPLSYEVHVPVEMEREKLGEVLQLAGPRSRWLPPPQWRTVYGNYWRVRSRQMPDTKVRTPLQRWEPGRTFVSTDDATFAKAQVGDWLRSRFAEPSPYEMVRGC